jgi:hypothetical protein
VLGVYVLYMCARGISLVYVCRGISLVYVC